MVTNIVRSKKSRIFLTALSMAVLLIGVLCSLYDPIWMTNDDVGMSMAAHGYGLASVGSPNLIFSNVVWGYLVRLIPSIHDVLGYSLATFSTLALVALGIAYCSETSACGWMATSGLLVLVLVRPVLFPQFTINAGLLAVVAVLGAKIYERYRQRKLLIVFVIAAFASFLIRDQEFFLVCLVAIPFIDWRAIYQSRSYKIAMLILAILVLMATLVNRRVYESTDWHTLIELKPVMTRIIDFHEGALLKERPKLLEQFGYSNNDIDLLTNWFFVDTEIANPDKLKAMLSNFSVTTVDKQTLKRGVASLVALFDIQLALIVVAGLAILLVQRNRKVFFAWLFLLVSIVIIGMMGRPGIIRVYYPVLAMLVVIPFLIYPLTSFQRRITTGVLVICAVINFSLVSASSKAASAAASAIQMDIKNLSVKEFAVWGGEFPFEQVYPALHSPSASLELKIHALGGFTFAPFTIASTSMKAGNGFLEQLKTPRGIDIVARDHLLDLLSIYCREHHLCSLSVTNKIQNQAIQVSNIRCW